MNTNLFKTKFLLIAVVAVSLFSCEKEFLDRPTEDSYNVDDFYKTTDQVLASTNALYAAPWFNFNTNTIWTIGELSSGNGRTWDPRNADFTNFAINGNHSTLTQAWESLYAVVAQSNAVINTLPEAAGVEVPQDVVDTAVGEARFIRSVAYFYLVRIFGSVPIIDNNNDYVLEPVVPRNTVADVYRFITEDLEFAIENITTYDKASAPGRVSSNGAKAMLAKVYLYMENYSDAYQFADDVINNGEFRLFGGDSQYSDSDDSGSYYDLFTPENDNNQESIFALQWTASPSYGEGNGLQSLFGPSGFTGGSDGWSAIGPSPDLLAAYEDQDEDVRYYATFMKREAEYPDLNGGYTVPDNVDAQGTDHIVKKYVVGSAAATLRDDGSGQTTTSNNTYILRYADLLLVHAEAALRGGGPVVNGVESYNKVRLRAGLEKNETPTLDDIFNERRVELAFEFEFWYDVVRLGEAEAIEFLSNSDRGTINNDTGEVEPEFYTATAEDLLFPYPTTETQNNPALLEAPVPYY